MELITTIGEKYSGSQPFQVKLQEILLPGNRNLLLLRDAIFSFLSSCDFGASLKRADEHHFFLDITFY